MEEVKKIDPQAIWGEYDTAKNYKASENLYNIIARNEAYYAGDQWRNMKDKNLPTPTFNFLEQLVDVKVSTIMANQISIFRKPDELSEENEKVVMAAKAFQEADKKNWERLKMDTMNEEMLLDGALSGLGATHWFWDNDIKSGNEFLVQGDFDGETIDSVNLYVSNPNELDIQKQDWVIISMRKSVKQVQEMARKAGIPEEEIAMIKGDADYTYEGYDKAQHEQDGSKESSTNTTILLKYWKYLKVPMAMPIVKFCKTTKEVLLTEKETGLTRYPVAIMPWKIRKRFIYGNAEITYIISNQQHVNKMEAMRQLHAQLLSIPKVGYNKNMISGFTNQVGGIYPVNAEPGTDLSNAIHYWQPTQMTIDVDKSIESAVNMTREFKGINDNVVGAEKPDNYSAIIAQQKAAGVPLESIKRRFYQYLEDVALIWLDFYKTKYNMTRKLKTEEGETIEFTGTDFADVDLKTKIDVGASTQFSEPLVIGVLDNLLDKQVINPVQYIQRYPKNIIPEQEKLLEEIGGTMNQGDEYAQMEQFVRQLPEDIRQVLMQMGDQSTDTVMEMMQMDPEQLNAFIEEMRGMGA